MDRGGACTHRIRLWPRPEAVTRNASGGWERCYPEFKLVGYPLPKPRERVAPAADQLTLGLDVEPDASERQTKKQAYDLLRRTLPPSYALALAPFGSHQWNLIVFLSFARRFYDLLKGNPVLAFLLANRREFNWRVYRREIAAGDLAGMKQPALLKLLELPGSGQMAQITRKIHPASASLGLVETLGRIGKDRAAVKKLSHLKRINVGVLALLSKRVAAGARVSPGLLEEVSRRGPENHYPLAAGWLEECMGWHHELRPGLSMPVLRTLEALERYHTTLVDEVFERLAGEIPADRRGRRSGLLETMRHRQRIPFPPPPIAATATIAPIRTYLELLIEGNRQHNCVAGYDHRIQTGQCYIYRVREPERATLLIVPEPGGEWSIGDLRLACNARAADRTRQAVEEWLANARLGM